jgi:hypothetical protein
MHTPRSLLAPFVSVSVSSVTSVAAKEFRGRDGPQGNRSRWARSAACRKIWAALPALVEAGSLLLIKKKT